MVAKPPRAVSLTSEMKCGPSTRSSRSLRATAASSSARMAAEASIRDVVSHTPAGVELLEVVEGAEVPAQDAHGEHAREGREAHGDPEPGAPPVGGVHVLHDRLVGIG
jgi:hypothetical protein